MTRTCTTLRAGWETRFTATIAGMSTDLSRLAQRVVLGNSKWFHNPGVRSRSRGLPADGTHCRLAYAEMQLIIARLLWGFDIELVDKDVIWTDQKIYWSWLRTPLMMKLTTPLEKDTA